MMNDAAKGGAQAVTTYVIGVFEKPHWRAGTHDERQEQGAGFGERNRGQGAGRDNYAETGEALVRFPRRANRDGIQAVAVDPRQNTLGGFSPLRCTMEKVAASQPCRLVNGAVPNTPRSTGFNSAVKSVLVIFHTR